MIFRELKEKENFESDGLHKYNVPEKNFSDVERRGINVGISGPYGNDVSSRSIKTMLSVH